MHRWSKIFLILLIPVISNGQSLSSKGRFSVEFNRGCNPLTVNISELDAFGAVTRQYYYFEGADITNSTTYTYTSPGIYTIVQVVGVDNIGDKSDTLQIEVLASQRPAIEIKKCSNLEVEITSVDTFYDSIRVYFGGPDSVTLQRGELTTYSFPTNQIQNIGLKGLFDRADEVCQLYFEEVLPINSLQAPIIQEAFIKEVCKDQYALFITIDGFDDRTNYRINLQQGGFSTRVFDDLIDDTFLAIDNFNFNPADYCITLEAFDPCNNAIVTSNEICQTFGPLSLTPFENLYSSYESGNIYLNMDSLITGNYEVYRRFEGSDYELRTTATDAFNDPIGSLSRKYFYKIDYRDSCNNVLYSAETHPPFIEATEINDNEYEVIITAASNSLTGTVTYDYEVGNPNSLSSEVISSPSFNLRLNAANGTPKQYLKVASTYNASSTIHSNTLILKYELVVYVPTAFTPNGDGLNDRLEIFGLPSENATINIYSKWGQLIYSTTDPTIGWDGTVGGSLASEGTYLYDIVFESSDGKLLRQKGTFALIKK